MRAAALMLVAAAAPASADVTCDSLAAGTINTAELRVSSWAYATYFTPALPYNGLYLLSRRAGGDTASSPDLTVDTEADRGPGTNLLGLYNQGRMRFHVGSDGAAYAGSQGSAAAFVDASAISGHLGLTVWPGLYLYIAGQLPDGYNGHHGAVTVGNAAALQRAGWALQVMGEREMALVVDYEGGLTQVSGYQTNTFAHCGGGTGVNNVADGGRGNVDESALMYASDRHFWCFCLPSANDGGEPGTTGDGWRQVADPSKGCAE